MATAAEESFFYCHKKFSHRKRSRTDSLNSSSTVNDYLKEENQGLNDCFIMQATAYSHLQNSRSLKSADAECHRISIGIPNDTLLIKKMPATSESDSFITQINAGSDLKDCKSLDNPYSKCYRSSSAIPNDVPPTKRIRRTSTSDSLITQDTVRSNLQDCTDSKCLVECKSSCSLSFSSLIQPLNTSTPLPSIVIPPAAAILPKISDETLRSICKYHGNMVRKFPKKERTPKDQERRNKNTIACRMSRRVKKLEQIAIEEQHKEFSQKTFDIIRQSLKATAYLHELMKLSTSKSQPKSDIVPALVNTGAETAVCAAPSPQRKKLFTIAYLAGIEES